MKEDRAFDEGIGEAIEILQSLSPLDEQDSFSDSWSGFMEFLDRRYPEDIFGAGKDPGPMIVRLSRELAKHELSLSPPSSSRGAAETNEEIQARKFAEWNEPVGKGPWLLTYLCCGYTQRPGQRFQEWGDADAMRLNYELSEIEGHERRAILSKSLNRLHESAAALPSRGVQPEGEQ